MTNPPSTAPDGATADSDVKVEAFSPGPWEADTRDYDATWDILDRNENTVASVPNPYEHLGDRDDLVDWARPITEANARLIAAAPELLEALRELADAFPSGGIVDGVKQKEDPALTGARAAIAKATGQ